MVARTVEFLKEEQIGNICLFADSEGEVAILTRIDVCITASAPQVCISVVLICRGCTLAFL